LWKHAMLPGALYLLLKNHRADFLYGNVSADIIIGKQLVAFELHCHNWTVARQFLENAEDDRQRAFAYGYLAHLAADTVAHNHFIPKYLLIASKTKNFGHSFWEMRADALIDKRYRRIAEELGTDVKEYHDPLLERTLTRAIFSYKTNRRVFTSLLYLSKLRQWELMTSFFTSYSTTPLPKEEMERFHQESLERMAAILTDPYDSPIASLDPTGGKQLYESRLTRKSLRSLVRQGVVTEDVYHKVAEVLYSAEGEEREEVESEARVV
ncbi:MAG: zinc dependent phospholipase C family protein, partial [Nitrospirota bacterium]|nr:zinc dependent phospholipase C family protein [Nitrospirota bacterium]